MEIPQIIFDAYDLDASTYSVASIGSGHIHKTYKLEGSATFIVQRVNKNVFKKPEVIAANIRAASDFLRQQHPDFLFLSTVKTKDGKEMVYDDDGYPWRMFPYLPNTTTIDEVKTPEEAYSAAREFGRLTKNLEGVDVNKFKPTIDRFHDLAWRWEQFETAYASAEQRRIKEAQSAIKACNDFSWLVTEFKSLTSGGILKERITHNDTKINNVLFDATNGKAICAIDLDTLMPGYFIYDLGDMMRTFVSPANEEEKDLSKIIFRDDIFQALVDGYQSAMRDVLTTDEIRYIPFGGMMMTYIMAMRMLTDFLNGDIYYHTKYPGQNLVRATNQFHLLSIMKKKFQHN